MITLFECVTETSVSNGLNKSHLNRRHYVMLLYVRPIIMHWQKKGMDQQTEAVHISPGCGYMKLMNLSDLAFIYQIQIFSQKIIDLYYKLLRKVGQDVVIIIIVVITTIMFYCSEYPTK